MKRRKKNITRLIIEQLEDRITPSSWLTYSPGPFSVKGQSDFDYAGGEPGFLEGDFQLTASIVTRSDRYGVEDANGDGHWQAVQSSPNSFEPMPVLSPNEWSLLFTNFPRVRFGVSL